MTPKKSFAMTVVLALAVAMGLAAGVLPGAGVTSLSQIVSAQDVYDLVTIVLDNDNNTLTPVPETIELTAGEQILINAVGTYSNASRWALRAGDDVGYVVDPFDLGTIGYNTGEVRVRFTATPDANTPELGTVTAFAVPVDVWSDPLNILVLPLELTEVMFISPADGANIYVSTTTDTNVTARALTDAPAVTEVVDFSVDGSFVGSDTAEPYDVLVTVPTTAVGTTQSFLAEAYQDGSVAATDTAAATFLALPTDTDGNGVPDDPFEVVDGVAYTEVDGVKVAVADVFPPTGDALHVVTADGVGIELPADIYDNIVGVDLADIADVRIVTRTAADIADILASTPGGLPDVYDLLGAILDIHMVVELQDGTIVEVHEFTSPITIRMPVTAETVVELAQLFGISTEFDLALDPPTYDPVVVGDAFAQMSAMIDIEGAIPDLVMVFDVTEFTTYVPLSAEGAPRIDTVVPSQGSEAGGTTVTVTGANFDANAAVTIGGVAADLVEVINPGGEGSSVVVTTGRRAVDADEWVDVTLLNPDDGLFDTDADAFMYLAEPPEITSIWPTAGAEGDPLTITGDFFDTDSEVWFNQFIPGPGGGLRTVQATITFLSETQIDVDVPAAPAGLGAASVLVLNPGSGTSDSAQFTYVEPLLLTLITGCTTPDPADPCDLPAEGPETGGTNVRIVGSNLPNLLVAQVMIGDAMAAVTYVYEDNTWLLATTGAYSVLGDEVVDVVVSNSVTGQSDSLLSAYTYTPVAPVVTALTPGSGFVGDTVMITGDYFDPDVEVYFGAGNAAVVDVFTETQLDVTVPDGSGTVEVTVLNPSGGFPAVSAGDFTYEVVCPLPVITSVDPVEGPTSGGTLVTIIGTDFNDATAVQFGTMEANTFEVASATQINAETPAHAAGTVGVTVTTPCGSDTLADAFTFVGAPPPSMVDIRPNQGSTTGGTEVWIMGTDFDTVGDVTVMFGDAAAPDVFVPTEEPDPAIYDPRTRPQGAEYNGPGTLIICSTPVQTAGVVDVTVSQDSGSDVLMSAFTFVEPEILLSASDVVGLPNDLDGSVGEEMNVAISLSRSGETAGWASAVSFTVLYDPAALTPVADLYGDDPRTPDIEENQGWQIDTPGEAATISGKLTTSNVYDPVNGAVRVIVYGGTGVIEEGEIVVLHFNVADGAERGRYPLPVMFVSAAAGDGSSIPSGGVDGEAIIGTQPVITSILNPATGTASGWVDDVIVIEGSNFDDSPGTVEVYFGDAMGTVNLATLTDTYIEVTVPDQAGGAVDGQLVDLTVTNPDEALSDTVANGFQYLFVPPGLSLNLVNPDSGSEIGGDTVVITGDYLPPMQALEVTFGGVAAAVSAVTNYYAPGSTATVTTPAYPVGPDTAVDVVATNTVTGETDTLVAGFTYTAEAPVVSSVTPDQGVYGWGTDVTVAGMYFDSNATVTFGGSAATNVVVVSDTEITCNVPDGSGTVDVTVTNPDSTLSGTLGSAFTYMVPQILNLQPNRGSIDGGTTVTINGSWFAANATVTFDGVAATNVTPVSATQITCTSPAGAALGAVDVLVIQASGTSDAVTFTYVPAGQPERRRLRPVLDCNGRVRVADGRRRRDVTSVP